MRDVWEGTVLAVWTLAAAMGLIAVATAYRWDMAVLLICLVVSVVVMGAARATRGRGRHG